VPGNAYYCPSGNFLAWDENLMRAGYTQIGDAWVYLVIAHEWGHAIQAQLPERFVSQAVELQADCLAGVWMSEIKRRLGDGEIEGALNAAAQIGDDTLQRRTQGRVVPESFTHGSAQQRMRWLKRGYDTGKTQSCDTFGTSEL